MKESEAVCYGAGACNNWLLFSPLKIWGTLYVSVISDVWQIPTDVYDVLVPGVIHRNWYTDDINGI